MPPADERRPLPLYLRPPTPLWTLTLAEVMSPPDAPESMSEWWDRRVRDGWRDLDRAVERHGLRDSVMPSGVDGYAIAYHLRSGTIAVIETASGIAVGGLFEGNLHVLAGHQRRGLAAAVMDLAFEVGIKKIGHNVALSRGGRATRRAAHRLSVARALVRGLAVRPEVLADYPDLAPADEAMPAMPGTGP